MPRRDDTRLILLEGISGAGKSTILRLLNEMRNFQDHHWHRWASTKFVYGVLERREVSIEQLRQDEEKIQKIWPTTLVTLTCHEHVALARKQSMPNEYIENNIAEANKLFLIYHNHFTAIERKIIVNTEIKTPQQCAELILARVMQ